SISVVLTFNVYLLLLIVILAIMLLFLPKLISKPLQNLTNNVSEKNQLYIDLIQKWTNGLAILQRYQAKNKLLSVLSGGASALDNAKVKKEKTSTKIDTLSTSLNMLAQSLILFLAGFLIIIKQLNFGVF
ncbi:ABC transporter ATP-binding protein, partial [Lactobacillus sp. XV13L]|nr:ABC transporter ATP-binding protein [Lactobacillus sp. XV13L]